MKEVKQRNQTGGVNSGKKIVPFDSGKMLSPGWHGSYVRASVFRSGMRVYPQGILTVEEGIVQLISLY